MMLLWGRRASIAATAELPPNGSGTGRLSPPALVSQSLLSSTIAIATYLRDNPMSAPLPEALGTVARRPHRAGFWFWTVSWLIATAILLGAIPNIPAVRRFASASFPSIFAGSSTRSCH